jgi:uncharacterized protein
MLRQNSCLYVDRWKHRIALQQNQNRALADQAKQKLPQIVHLLTAQFQATQIILFGSLAKGTFRQGSDIDLAVAGIPPQQYFSALAAANRLSDSFQIDLKPLEDLEPQFYQRVIQTGECLYGADICRSDSRNCV